MDLAKLTQAVIGLRTDKLPVLLSKHPGGMVRRLQQLHQDVHGHVDLNEGSPMALEAVLERGDDQPGGSSNLAGINVSRFLAAPRMRTDHRVQAAQRQAAHELVKRG